MKKKEKRTENNSKLLRKEFQIGKVRIVLIMIQTANIFRKPIIIIIMLKIKKVKPIV